MTHKIVDPLAVPEWDDLVLSYHGYSFFHSSPWLRVLRDSYGYTPLAVVSRGGAGNEVVIPVMQIKSVLTGTRGVSLPFSDSCPVLCRGDGQLVAASLEAILQFGRAAGWDCFQVRAKCRLGDCVESRFVDHVLPLDTTEQRMFDALGSATRRNIRKAKREGLCVRMATSLDAVKAFYCLHVRNRRSHGLPPQPFSFFANLHRYILSTGKGCLFEAVYDDRVVAAGVYLHFGRKAVYKYGASDPQYLWCRPNNLVMWEAIKHYASQGCQQLSLGRTDLADKGLIRYKDGWGADRTRVGYCCLRLSRRPFSLNVWSSRGNWIFSMMPLPVLQAAGTLLYRHFG